MACALFIYGTGEMHFSLKLDELDQNILPPTALQNTPIATTRLNHDLTNTIRSLVFPFQHRNLLFGNVSSKISKPISHSTSKISAIFPYMPLHSDHNTYLRAVAPQQRDSTFPCTRRKSTDFSRYSLPYPDLAGISENQDCGS